MIALLLFLAADPLQTVWIRSTLPIRSAPDVHSVRVTDDAVYVESAGISLQSFGSYQAGAPAPSQAIRHFEYRIPRQPKQASSNRLIGAPIAGTFVNGVPIYNVLGTASWNDQNLWHFDAFAQDHGKSPLLEALQTRQQPLIIGYALDGYPIYFGGSRRLRSSFQLHAASNRPANFPLGTFAEDYEYQKGTGDLDEHNGQFVVTPEFPNGTYAYFMTSTFPYLIGPSFYGEIDDGTANLRRISTSEDWTLLARDGELTLTTPLTNLERVHERLIHLFVVSDDLKEFDHIHPEPVVGGVFRVKYNFPKPGRYRLYADYTPAGGSSPKLARFELTTTVFEARSTTKSPLTVSMKTDRPLETYQDVNFQFTVRDAATNLAVSDLEPYLGAWAHILMISANGQEVVHIHPNEANGQHSHSAVGPSPSEISATTGFQKPGHYKLWLQLQRAGAVITTPFEFDVKEGSTPKPDTIPTGAIRIEVSANGFEPARITARPGIPLTLAFIRKDAQNCAREVLFPNLNIRKDLLVGKPVLVQLIPQKEELAFTCGMAMFRGSLVAR